MGSGQPVVAGERELAAAAERRAVHRGDRRLGHALDLAERQVGVVGQGQGVFDPVHVLEDLPDIGAGHEGRALAGEHHRADVLAPRKVVDTVFSSSSARSLSALTGGLLKVTAAISGPPSGP